MCYQRLEQELVLIQDNQFVRTVSGGLGLNNGPESSPTPVQVIMLSRYTPVSTTLGPDTGTELSTEGTRDSCVLFYSQVKFIWATEESGYRHLYLVSVTGKSSLIRTVVAILPKEVTIFNF